MVVIIYKISDPNNLRTIFKTYVDPTQIILNNCEEFLRIDRIIVLILVVES